MRVLLLLLLFLFIGPAVSGGSSNDGLIKGIGGHPNEFRGSAHEYSELVSGMKFNSFRTDYYWSNYERTPGVFITPNDKYQVVLNLLSKKNIRPLLILGYDNPLYFKGKPTTPSDIDHFANYSYNVCKQFYPIHPILQVWNEWSIDHKKPSSAQSYQSAVDYFNLVKAVSKKINGKCTLIAGDFNLNIPNDYMWGRTLVGLGLTNYIDGISIHMYDIKPLNIPNPRRTIELLSKFNDYLSSNHINTGLYVTEIGLPTYTWTKYTPKEVSLYAKKLFDLSKSYTFIKGIWWYDLIDDGNDKNNGEDNFGIFDYLGRDKGFSHDYIQ